MAPPWSRGLNIARYQWMQSQDDPALWQREALAGENLWLFRPKEVRELFLGGNLLLYQSKILADIIQAAQGAWRELRFQHPEIALTAHVDSSGKRFLELRVPRSEDDVQQWVKRTCIIEVGSDQPSFSNLQSAIIRKKSDSHDSALLYLQVQAENSTEATRRLSFLFNVDHLCTDGIGIRIIAGLFFRVFARGLSSGKHRERVDIRWQDIVRNLSPPWVNVMNEKQKTSGEEFDEAVARQFQFIDESANNWGLPLLSHSNPKPNLHASTAEFCFISLPRLQSSRLLRAVKSKLGPTATITHLCYASVVLALIRVHPPPKSDEPLPLLIPCIMNGRRYLLPSLSPQHTYIPVCQATGEVRFPNLHSYSASINSSKTDLLRILLQVFNDSRRSFEAIKSRQSILTESIPLIEHYANEKHDSQNSQKPQKQPERVEPLLLSDGIGEHYVDHIYFPNDEGTGTEVFTVEDLNFAANAEGPNLIVRLSTWRDAITLSGEWRSDQYARDVVERYLDDVLRLMLLIQDEAFDAAYAE